MNPNEKNNLKTSENVTENQKQPITNWGSLSVGDITPTNRKIMQIIAAGEDFIIYFAEPKNNVEENRLVFEYNEPLPKHVKSLFEEYRELKNLARIALNKSDEKKCCYLLAAGMNTCFHSNEEDDIGSCFDQARNYIETKIREPVRSKYMGFVLISAVIFSGFLLLIYFQIPDQSESDQSTKNSIQIIIAGCIAGVIGAVISVLQRGRNQEINVFASPIHLGFDAVIRMFLGMCFGGIVIILSFGDLAFGFVKENVFGLLFFSLGGGFSERLIPDMIERTVKKEASAIKELKNNV